LAYYINKFTRFCVNTNCSANRDYSRLLF